MILSNLLKKGFHWLKKQATLASLLLYETVRGHQVVAEVLNVKNVHAVVDSHHGLQFRLQRVMDCFWQHSLVTIVQTKIEQHRTSWTFRPVEYLPFWSDFQWRLRKCAIQGCGPEKTPICIRSPMHYAFAFVRVSQEKTTKNRCSGKSLVPLRHKTRRAGWEVAEFVIARRIAVTRLTSWEQVASWSESTAFPSVTNIATRGWPDSGGLNPKNKPRSNR